MQEDQSSSKKQKRMELSEEEKLKALRTLRMQYAERMMDAAERLKQAGEEIRALEMQMMDEAVEATHGDSKLVTRLCIRFQPWGSISDQMDQEIGPLEFAGFDDVVNLSEYIIDHCVGLLSNGTEEEPPKLPYEDSDEEDA